MTKRRILTLVAAVTAAIVAIAVVSGCSSDDKKKETLTVLAAASLQDVMTPLEAGFDAEHGDTEFQVDFGPSSGLVEKLKSGAEADVLITANESTMANAVSNGDAKDPVAIATNTLVIVVPKRNPGNVSGLDFFANPGNKAIICETGVPCGTAAEEALTAIGAGAPTGPRAVDVRAALAAVTSGEMDAALVYATDAASAGDAVETITFENAPVVTNMAAGLTDKGKTFVTFLTSEKGKAIFQEQGFGTP